MKWGKIRPLKKPAEYRTQYRTVGGAYGATAGLPENRAPGLQFEFCRSGCNASRSGKLPAFSATAQQKLLSFNIDLPDERFKAFVDVEAFHKIISNLISNALKYAATRAVITVELPDEQGKFRIKVANDGPLIPWQLRKKYLNHFSVYRRWNNPDRVLVCRLHARWHSFTVVRSGFAKQRGR
ncbi:ATP-binding protein [Chitinophaga sedimenti]|nr:ATP-binding protein [Chitinophaga sedimenti]MCK7557589.1 ATP-binding protein [Chitinophaga sedimenti]